MSMKEVSTMGRISRHILICACLVTEGVSSLDGSSTATANVQCYGDLPLEKPCHEGGRNVTRRDADPASVIEIDPWYETAEVNSHTGDLDAYWDELECETIFDQLEGDWPIPDTATWMLMRGTYVGVVGPHYSTLDPDMHHRNAFKVPVEVRNIPGKGRGIVAAADIPEGVLVWDYTLHTAYFPSPVYFRRFLTSLPVHLACDVLIWAYVEEFSWDEHFAKESDDSTKMYPTVPTIAVDLDPGSLFNTVDPLTNTEKNVDGWTSMSVHPIAKGEEILVDYADFEDVDGWTAAGFPTAYFEENWEGPNTKDLIDNITAAQS